MTGEYSIEVALKAFESGVADYFVKPIPFPQLLHSIKRSIKKSESIILNQQKYMDVDHNVVGISNGFQNVLNLAKKVAPTQCSILLTGETGTGKEVIANNIHKLSLRTGPFVAINCAAIPENLLESELFGHSKGSFTGANDKRMGLFEEANGGTLFLDEIGELSMPLQAKLLRVIQEKKIRRVGENTCRDINIRIISATHKNLQKEISKGFFREDLFFRLNIITIQIPPLRERIEDIAPLADFFLKRFIQTNKNCTKFFTQEFYQKLKDHSWEGNVRELENTIERSIVLSDGEGISFPIFYISQDSPKTTVGDDIFFQEIKVSEKKLSLEELNFQYIKYIFQKNRGAKEQTARDLGIDRKTLYRKLKEIEKINLH